MTAEDFRWHRISPLSMIHHLLGVIRQLAGNNLGALIGLVAGAWAFANRAPGLALLVLVAILTLGIAGLIASWLRFGYRLREDAIQVRRGVFTQQRLTLHYDRVQTVRLEYPPYLRPFGLVRLSIESAGSSGQEVHLAGIPLQRAQAIRNRALEQQAESSLQPAEQAPQEHLLLTRSVGDIVRYGLSSPIIVWGALALSSLFGAATRQLEEDDDREAQLAELYQMLTDLMPAILAFLSVVLVLILLLIAFSIALALLRFSRYRLYRQEDRYRCQAGLLTQREQVLRQHKIQHLSLNQNLVARLFRRRHLTCHQIGMFQGGPEGASNQLTAPALEAPDQARLVEEFYPGLFLSSLDFQPVSRRFMLPRLAFWMPLWLILLATLFTTGTGTAGWLISLLVGPGAVLLIWLAWYRQGWALTPDYLVLRNGLAGTNYVVFTPFRGQAASLSASPLQRRAGLCNLTIRLSSGAFQITYISREQGVYLMDHLLAEMESSSAPWL